MSTLKQLRLENNATQQTCANLLKISLRSYKDYENNVNKSNTAKYNYLCDMLAKHFELTETTGVLSKEQIEKICNPIFKQYKIDYCYLFGSYAKNKAKEDSDVDLLISSNCNGLKFYELAEVLREKLHKKVDLLDMSQLTNNKDLLNEILKSGVKIYG